MQSKTVPVYTLVCRDTDDHRVPLLELLCLSARRELRYEVHANLLGNSVSSTLLWQELATLIQAYR